MKKLSFFVLVLTSSFVIAEEPVCHKCQIIREYNRTHKETDFIYYEDYLKDKKEKASGKEGKDEKDQEDGKDNSNKLILF